MRASARTLQILLLCLWGSATSSPVSTFTPAPPLPLQVGPPSASPALLPSPPPPSLSASEASEKVGCPLTMSPSNLVVRFGDPVRANCSVSQTGFSGLGWVLPDQGEPAMTMDHYLVWRVERLNYWSIEPVCFAMSEQGGQCDIHLPVTVYKPPDRVSIGGPGGPMVEGSRYSLVCSVEDVAPLGDVVVTFYRGETPLGKRQSNSTEKTPESHDFMMDVTASKEDDGVRFWCEAKLELGPGGPQSPPVMTSQNITANVHFGPQLLCPVKLQVKEGERLSCDVTGNPQPKVTWFRHGQPVAPPTHSSREDAGNYTISAIGLLGERNITVEVEVVVDSGTQRVCDGRFLLAILFLQTFIWL